MMKIGPAARVAIAASVLGVTHPVSPARAQDSSGHLDALRQLNGSILGVDITGATAGLAASVRVPSGVVVLGHTTNETRFINAGLMTADTIHAINNQSVTSVGGLRAAVDAIKPRSPVVLQIERSGQFIFLAFELD